MRRRSGPIEHWRLIRWAKAVRFMLCTRRISCSVCIMTCWSIWSIWSRVAVWSRWITISCLRLISTPLPSNRNCSILRSRTSACLCLRHAMIRIAMWSSTSSPIAVTRSWWSSPCMCSRVCWCRICVWQRRTTWFTSTMMRVRASTRCRLFETNTCLSHMTSLSNIQISKIGVLQGKLAINSALRIEGQHSLWMKRPPNSYTQ